MKIRIDTPMAKLTADLTKEQVTEILGIALDYAVGFESLVSSEPSTLEPIEDFAPAPSEPVPVRIPKAPKPVKTVEFKGFMYLKCEECGKLKGFMPKTPISNYRCDCGHVTKLQNMTVMRVNCKCGVKFKYLTNAEDSTLSIDCINCGSPVDLEYHERKQEYLTISEEN